MDPKRKSSARIVWFAITASIGLYYFIAWQHEAKNVPSQPVQDLSQVFLTAAAALFLLAMLLPRFFSRKIKSGDPRADDKVFLGVVLRCCLFEGVALCGFVLAFQTGKARGMLPFMMMSIYGMLRTIPTEALFASFRSNLKTA